MIKPKEICKFYEPLNGECASYQHEGFCKIGSFFRCPVYEFFFLSKISVSEANTWMKCHRLYKFQYIDGWRIIPKMLKSQMKIGLLIHEGFSNLYKKNDEKINYDIYFNEDEGLKEIGIVKIILDYAKDNIDIDSTGKPEFWIEINNIEDCPKIVGKIDVMFPNHFIELKATSNPDYYLTPHFIQSQIATYFIYYDEFEYCIMQPIRIPALKSTGRYVDEDAYSYCERVQEDIKKRPAFYFIGLKDKQFGKRFYRSEFNLDEVIRRYKLIMQEKRIAIRNDYYYKDETKCLYPFQCDFYNACVSGGFSELIYEKRKVKLIEEEKKDKANKIEAERIISMLQYEEGKK